MAGNWGRILSTQKSAWNIPGAEVTELAVLTGAADAALTAAKNETVRTPAATAQCRETFKKMEDKMRDIKKRYFHVPPLTEPDLINLGL
jgi:hypothetical protein